MTTDDRAWLATRKGLFELRRSADQWTLSKPAFPGDPVSMMLPPDRDGTMFAALNLGHFGVKVHRSADAGRTWSEITTPVYPPQPEDAEGPAWKLVQIWSLERDGQASLWAGTLPGGLFRSDDGGDQWQLVDSLWQEPGRSQWFGGGFDCPGIHSILPHPHRTGELLVGVSCGGAWRSQDHGASWTVQCRGMHADYMPPESAEEPNAQDPHRIERCLSVPDVLWCQHHNGIWRSTDNADSWQEITTSPVSNFGFAVAAHPDDPQSAWFVPAQADQCRVPVDGAFVVNRTSDGGRSFETFREGLPQSHSYELVYRHGLAVAPGGRHLLMASTTGGLWSSSDGGEHWTLVSHNLPPVHAVRFG